MELLTLGLLLSLLVSTCRGGKDTDEDLAHYVVTLPSTLEPPSSLEKKVYKDIEDAIHLWQTAPETEEPSVDSQGSTVTPEPRAPRWWNQYMQEKYGDPPEFPDWSNETQVDLYLKNKKPRKKWTPSQESEEPKRPDEEPFTWTPFVKDSDAWTQPTWDEAEVKRLGDALVEHQSSGGSYGEYQDGPDPSGNNSSESSQETGPVIATNKSASAIHRRPGSPVIQGLKTRMRRGRMGGHGPAMYNQDRRRIMRGRAIRRNEGQRRDFLKAQLSPEDVETVAEAQNRHLMAVKAYQRKKKNEALKRVWHSAVLKKLRNEVGVHRQDQGEGRERQQEFKARKRRPVSGNLQRALN